MSSRSRPPKHPDPSLVADEVIAPDSRTERLNTQGRGRDRPRGHVQPGARACARAGLRGAVRRRRLMDAFTAAFRIPNLLRDLFAEGALSTAFVTTFCKTIAREGDAAAWRLAEQGRHSDGARARRCCACSACCFRISWSRCSLPASTPDKARADCAAHADHVPFHPAGLAGRAGHGRSECKEHLRPPRHGVELLQHRLHRRRRGARLPDRPHIRAPSPDRPRDRHAHRRRRCNSQCSCRRSRDWATASIPISAGAIRG